MYVIVEILTMIANTANMLLIVWFVIGLLFAFNVIGRDNQFMVAVNDALGRLFEPALRPIRRVLPDTGSIDFSPMVLMLIIIAVIKILTAVAMG